MIARMLHDGKGQAAVEYLVVGLVVIVVAAGLGAVWRFVSGADFSLAADEGASHAADGPAGLADALAY